MIIGSIVWINGTWTEKIYEVMGWTESGYPILDSVHYEYKYGGYVRSRDPFIHTSSKELHVRRM